MNEARKEASCSKCDKLTEGNPRFCNWLLAEIPRNLPDDPGCEGFHEKGLGTSKAEVGPSHVATSLKGDDKPVTKPSKAGCPKTPGKKSIQKALKLKGFKGSVVMERVCCGGRGCHCQNGGALHGPYPYLHYYSNKKGKKGGKTKIKRRYLSKTMTALLSHSREELEEMLRETVLGQQKRSSEKSSGVV
ncbi:MAG: DUF6788 family protein [Candidatus Bathyarchaeia archaeon]